MFNVPAWSMIKNVYHYKDVGSPNLLITVGDSWTWGDSLGKSKVRLGHDDEPYRLTHIYGALMQKEMGCNWVNIALPGGSNALILTWLMDFLPFRGHYKSVDCVITLTETGRHEELNAITSAHQTQQQALTEILAQTYQRIEKLKQIHPGVKFTVAHNFTDSLPGAGVVEKSWLEVLCNKDIQDGTHIVVSEHIEQMNYPRRFSDVGDIIDRANRRIDLLDSCEYCNKEDSRHPTDAGHQLWARYLLGKI